MIKKIFYFCLIFLALPTIMKKNAFCQEYALVLAGGGGKGAYEVGVWKALCEYGIGQRVTVFSGTSVGGLNSALFSCVSPQEAERIWIEQVPSYLTKDDALISQEGLLQIINEIPLNILQHNPFPKAMVTTIRKKGKILGFFKSSPGSAAYRYILNDEEDLEEIKKELLATAAFPVLCPPVTLKDGYQYTDGGEEATGGDNVPFEPVVQKFPEIQNIIVVYLSDRNHIKRRIQKKNWDFKNIDEFFPSIDTDGNGFWEKMLDGTANFTANRIKLLIRQGYEDTVEILRRKGFYPLENYWFE